MLRNSQATALLKFTISGQYTIKVSLPKELENASNNETYFPYQ